MRYAIMIEPGKNNYSAYAPDVPGCVATGETLEDVEQRMKEALEFHLEGMALDGETIPDSTCLYCHIDVKLPKGTSLPKKKSRRSVRGLKQQGVA